MQAKPENVTGGQIEPFRNVGEGLSCNTIIVYNLLT